MKRVFVSFFLIVVSSISVLQAQSDSSIVIFTNSQDIRLDRYRDIKGTPYLFDDFVLATIVSSNIDIYENVPVNYNGYTKGFEVRRGNRFIELDERWYLRVEIDPEINTGLIEDYGKEKLIFQRNIHPKLDFIFAHVLYAGIRTVLFKTFESDLTKQKIENVGKTVEFQRFVDRTTYYLIKDGQLEVVGARKKSFLKVLGNDKSLETFVKENNIDFDKDQDLKKLVEFYDKNL